MGFLLRRGFLLFSSSVKRPVVSVIERASSSNVTLDSDLAIANHVAVSTIKKKDALLPVSEEELVDVAPEIRPTFNLAAYANK